ncbi:MAG: FliM/FliN family flagellar motor switch protein [Oscillospiraceae bacterium]|nr:FliM/FliN family flagellar motor switch protein [Oscillospiraceae bacterium]
MADALTQEQIDAMLNSAMSGEALELNPSAVEITVKDYDFRAPKKLTKERMKILDNIFDNYARLMSSYLTGLLRLYCKVTLVSIEEQKYFEFNNALPDYVMMGIISLKVDDEDVDDVTAIVQLSNSISYIMIDRLLGGKGEYTDSERDFTEIEINVMNGIIKSLAGMFQEPWENYVELDPVLEKIETNSRVISNIGYDDTMVIAVLEVHLNDIKSIVSVCIPALELDGVMQKYATFNVRGNRKSDAAREDERKETIMTTLSQSLLNVTAVLGETNLDMFDVMNLQMGDIIPLGKSIDGNIMLNIAGQTWFDGKLGVYNSKKAIKIETVLKSDFEA